MILGIGIDIVEIPRIRLALARHGERFIRRIFTEHEAEYCSRAHDPAERFAARFAAKEAVMKALGTGKSRGVLWREIEVISVAGERPTIKLWGTAHAWFLRMGGRRSQLSISHSANTAVAQVILEA